MSMLVSPRPSCDLLLVNAAHPLPTGPSPDLMPADPRFPDVLLQPQAARALAACLHAVGGRDGIVPVSGWRSRAEQQAIWDDTLAREGAVFTRKYVALPGCSEHQTGLAIDLGQTAPHIDFIRPDFPDSGLCAQFRKAAPRFGFILRYPAGKEPITGISHEPWHFRYVGTPHSLLMAELDLTLEEYLALVRSHPLGTPPLELEGDAGTWQVSFLEESAGHPPLPEGCRLAGDNCGGLVVTVWRERRATA